MNTEELRKIVDKAIPGPWRVFTDDIGETCVVSQKGKELLAPPYEHDKDTDKFIATFNPTMVGAMLDVIEAATRLSYVSNKATMSILVTQVRKLEEL